ncbi:MAG TPA: META domain-containing protein [Kribbella sp.]|nr:META domain-containing protein [Kribbella sp.]
MSKTELEDDLRATFERAAASVPFTPELISRASTGARQRQRRTWVASGAAAAGVAVLAAIGLVLQSGAPATTPAPVASPSPQVRPTPRTSTVSTAAMLSGTWRPVRLAGFTTLKAVRAEDPTLTFKADGTWSGSDGCNSITGTFAIGRRGEFSSTSNGQRLSWCDNVPQTSALAATRRITTDQSTLRFLGGDGREVAIYARTR